MMRFERIENGSARPVATRAAVTGGLMLAMALAGCSGGGSSAAMQAAGRAPEPTNLTRDALIGRWGIASFHVDKDRKRTEAQARAQCGQPYIIARGPDSGVMMHVADDPKLYQLRLKAGAGGRTYLGFEAEAGHPQDREILSASPDMLVMRFVDSDAHKRYGTFIFARCA